LQCRSDSGAKAGYGTLRAALKTVKDRARINGKGPAKAMKLPRFHLSGLLDMFDTSRRQRRPFGKRIRRDAEFFASLRETLPEGLSINCHASRPFTFDRHFAVEAPGSGYGLRRACLRC
jgi:hypothetical protein